MKILITGGAGFVGSNLALAYREKYPASMIVVLDNLKRRGSELNLPIFKQRGITFVHGDIRQPSDLTDHAGNVDLLIEASAEPSVLAGIAASPTYPIHTNLIGTLNCLEYARQRVGSFIFLSTSRVYSIKPLSNIHLCDGPTRFEIAHHQTIQGVSTFGIAENFPNHLPRSLYGATKLASEMMIQEYVELYGLRAVINRCGVIAGPGQFGRVDQGVFTLWVANHVLGKPLTYTGFGGQGKQVRDLLHPADLFDLIEVQVSEMTDATGQSYNVGGGRDISTSLCEFTQLCSEVVGNDVPIGQDLATSPVDVPLYISDYRRATQAFGWQPQRSVAQIVQEIAQWVRDNEAQLRPIFAS
jgi:CDP-paratose 2-epimerase